MTIAEFVNKIVSTFPQVVFVNIEDWDCLLATVNHAHHQYAIVFDTQFEVSEVIAGQRDYEASWEQNNFSKRIEGMLNGWKRNEAGEMVKVGVSRGSH